jgi:hypothetical protein
LAVAAVERTWDAALEKADSDADLERSLDAERDDFEEIRLWTWDREQMKHNERGYQAYSAGVGQ